MVNIPLAHFRADLLNWFNATKRDLPWRKNRSAWFTLLSEVMLQQTRVDQVLPYFDVFTKRFPTLLDFAKANQDEILLLWEGLGYYSRARNLHKTTQLIVEQFGGEIPETYDELITIKGIGPYTAAAVSSQVFNKPHAVVDGNVIRVISRLFGIQDDVTKAKTKQQIQEFAQILLDESQPGFFNEALMELGATVCTPKKPKCLECPLLSYCIAAQTLQSDTIPYKPAKKKVPHYHIGVGVVFNQFDEVLIAKRPAEAMLGGLWEFPGGKQESGETIEDTIHREFEEEIGITIRLEKEYPPIKHAYSHFKITLHAFKALYIKGEVKAKASSETKWISVRDLDKYAFPKANRNLIGFILADF